MFFDVPAERHVSKRLLLFLAAKSMSSTRCEENVVYVAKTAGEVSDFVRPLYFHHDPKTMSSRITTGILIKA